MSVWDIPYAAVGLAPMPVTGELALAGREEAEKAAGEAASRAEEAGVEYRTVVLRGSAVGEICAAAETFRRTDSCDRVSRLGRAEEGYFRKRLDRRPPPRPLPGTGGSARASRRQSSRGGAGRNPGMSEGESYSAPWRKDAPASPPRRCITALVTFTLTGQTQKGLACRLT